MRLGGVDGQVAVRFGPSKRTFEAMQPDWMLRLTSGFLQNSSCTLPDTPAPPARAQDGRKAPNWIRLALLCFLEESRWAAAEVSNKLSSNQYDETTWSARSWMAFASQQLSVAVQLAVADEISDSYDARCLACAGGDPRRWRVTAGGVRV